MLPIEWTSGLEAGSPEIDRQHRRIVEIVNRLTDAVAQRAPHGVILGAFADLAAYLQVHAVHESRISPASEHYLDGESLIRRVNSLESRVAAGYLEPTAEMVECVQAWILNHLITSAGLVCGTHLPAVAALARSAAR